MNLEALANIATIVESVFVIVSVIFIWRDLRTNTKLSQAANIQSHVELSSPFNMKIVEDREFAELWLKGGAKFDEMDEIDQERFIFLIFWLLNFYENMYQQYKRGLIDQNAFESWARSLKGIVKNMNLNSHRDLITENYPHDFVDLLISMMDASKSTSIMDKQQTEAESG